MTDELVDFPERDEVQWRQYLKEFRDTVYPIFAEHGFSFTEAYFAWRLEGVITSLDEITDR